jgi:formylmethanofuran dehydrogenase subunit C
MSSWSLQLRQPLQHQVDASPIEVGRFRQSNRSEIERLKLGDFELGELFQLTIKHGSEAVDRIVLAGDLQNCHHVAAQHQHGEFIVEGSVGDMLAGPCGSSHLGMRGGLVYVQGNAGSYAGHRARRGMLVVDGNVGALVASQMIAGTIIVGGTAGIACVAGPWFWLPTSVSARIVFPVQFTVSRPFARSFYDRLLPLC